MKHVTLCLLLCCLLLFSAACTESLDLTGTDAAEQVVSISSDPEPYFGREILFAGYYTYEDFGSGYHYVLLNESAEEENIGFEIRWEGAFPAPGTAVKVRGVLKSVTEYGQKYIYLDLTELTILERVE